MTSTTPRRRHGRIGLVAAGAALIAVSVGCASPPAEDPTVAQQLPAPAASSGLTATDVDAWLDGIIPAELDRSGIAGASVSVVHDGEILSSRGFGSAEVGTDGTQLRPVDPDRTLFRIGSVSKLFAATAVMQLVERGDLDLDTDVQEYLDFDLPTPEGAVTLRNLLTHTAGFEERVQGLIAPPGATPTLRETIAIDPPEQVYAPSAVPAYSNYGNALAGYIVERVSGTPYADYVDENILQRTGMDSSSAQQPLPDRLEQQLSGGYPDDSQPGLPFEFVGASPAGGISATATDMGRFMLAHLAELPVEQSLLRPETIELMREPALDRESLGVFAEGQPMGLGFFDESRGDLRIVGHDGDTQVFHSALQLLPDERTGIFLSVNGGGTNPLAAYLLRAAVMDEFVDRYFATASSTGTSAISPENGHAEMAAGTYVSSRALRSTFLSAFSLDSQPTVAARRDGRITVTGGPATFTPAVYEEIAPWVWRESGGHDLITMKESGGQVREIGFGGAFVLQRVDPAHDAAVATPILGGSLIVLALGALAWPISVVLRRRTGAARPSRTGRAARVLTRIGVGAALAASAAWGAVILAALSYQVIPEALLRGIQVAQVVAGLAVIPAVLQVIDAVRARAGWWSVAARALVVVALAGLGWFALVYKLIAPSISF